MTFSCYYNKKFLTCVTTSRTWSSLLAHLLTLEFWITQSEKLDFMGKIPLVSLHPPTKSLIIWIIFHNVVATDDNLRKRGLIMVSCCSLCGKQHESVSCLFFQCDFAGTLWNWFTNFLQVQSNFSYISELLNICNQIWSK
jgi:hypothetical protein